MSVLITLVTAIPTSIGLYHRDNIIKLNLRDNYDSYPTEDSILLEVESDPSHQSNNPGTVTVEGVGKEFWGYEDIHGRKREKRTVVSTFKPNEIIAEQLLRRVDELKHGEPTCIWDTERELDDLEEFGVKR